MGTRGNRRNWYYGQLPLWLRGLIVLAAAAGAVLCGQRVVEAYGATMTYRAAPACADGNTDGHTAGGGEECVRREAAAVLDRRTGERCTSDSTGGGTTTAGTVTGGGSGTTCTTYYSLKVGWPGRAEWLDVSWETYDEARAGDPAAVRLWRDEVVTAEVGDRTHTYPPSSEGGAAVWLAVGCLVLAAGGWGAVSGRLSGLLALHGFGLLFVAVGVGWTGGLALFGGHPVAWAFAVLWTGFAVAWTVGARRIG
ncbi:hypothetical protein ACFCX4_24450 [Kitasatospora sp. NPDC056327]|uniref:hypothetical protein n=1 Tax=Kitasatospora sp. NPDC056327 TaxID=3345785 RepID=UPI0035DC30F9